MSMILPVFVIFYTGCMFGSFLTLVGMRVPLKQSILLPRSHCDHCSETLGVFDLLPVVSFVLSKGRCRHCAVRLPHFYPLMELICGTGFIVAAFHFFGDAETALLLLLLVVFGTVFAVTDIYYLLLPDSIMRIFFFAALAFRFFAADPLFPYLFSGLVVFCSFYLMYLFSPSGIGGGDVKLFGVIALLLGLQRTLLTIFLSSFFSLAAHFLCGTKKMDTGQSEVPFGPFIFLGAFAAVLLLKHFAF